MTKPATGLLQKGALVLIVALILAVGVQAVKAFVAWERRSVEPFFGLAVSTSYEDVVRRVGAPHDQFDTDSALEEAADSWGLLCEQIERAKEKKPFPDSYEYPAAPNRLWDSERLAFVELPEVDFRVDVYRPAIRPVVMIYYSDEERITQLLVCSP